MHTISAHFFPSFRFAGVTLLVSLAVALTGCGGNDQNNESLLLPTMQDLENGQYQSSVTESGTVTLVRGTFRQALPTPPGGDLIVTLTRYRLIGRITPTQGGAALVLRSAYGPSGVLFDLAVVLTTARGDTNVALLGLGDRIKIRSMALRDRRIILQMTVHAPNDAPCCPTVDVENTYLLRNDRLELLSSDRLKK